MKDQGQIHLTAPHHYAAHIKAMLPDERLSSWCRRNSVQLELAAEDSDFGTVIVSNSLTDQLSDLQRAATKPPWDLIPQKHRTMYCPSCWLKDLSEGCPIYWRRSWAWGFRTACALHGPYCDLDLSGRQVSLREVLFSGPSPLGEVGIMHRATRWSSHATSYCGFNVYRDRRAIHLEAALEGEPDCVNSWKPKAYGNLQLHRLYWRIVDTLSQQFWHPRIAGAIRPFLLMHNDYRHLINVCAEAIIAVWTCTPLPTSHCSQLRTLAIARVLGWVPAAPDASCLAYMSGLPNPAGLLLCTSILLDADHENLARQWRKGSPQEGAPRLSTAEATAIGLGSDRIQSDRHPHKSASMEGSFMSMVGVSTSRCLKKRLERGILVKVH